MQPLVVETGQGETITDRAERTVVIKTAHELLDVTETRYTPDERGPDPHVHRAHADAFYVLEGELVFGLGPDAAERVTAGVGTFVLVPAGVVHCFVNEGPLDTRFLNIHAPSQGFAESLRVRRDGLPYDPALYDSFDPPADGGRALDDVVIRTAGQGDSVAIGPSRADFLAEQDDGDGTFSLTETTLAPGFPGPVLHVHDGLADSFYVLEGTLTVRVGEETTALTPGSYAFVPPGTPHTFSNPGDEPVRMLNLMAPGGFEQYLKEVARTLPPGVPPDPERMAEIASHHDFRAA